eukprot:g709.t1
MWFVKGVEARRVRSSKRSLAARVVLTGTMILLLSAIARAMEGTPKRLRSGEGGVLSADTPNAPDVQIDVLLGEGASGDVFGIKRNGRETAMKCLRYRNRLDDFRSKVNTDFRIPHEIMIMQEVTRLCKHYSHLFVELLDDNVPTETAKAYTGMDYFLCIEMERAPGWDLISYVDDAEATARAQALDPALLFRKSLILLDFLDEIGLMHHDMKPDNIIIDPETNNLKLIDFGAAVFVYGRSVEEEQEHNDGNPIDGARRTTRSLGEGTSMPLIDPLLSDGDDDVERRGTRRESEDELASSSPALDDIDVSSSSSSVFETFDVLPHEIKVASTFVEDALHFRYTEGRRVDPLAIRLHGLMHGTWRSVIIIIAVFHCAQILWDRPHRTDSPGWYAAECVCLIVYGIDVLMGVRMVRNVSFYNKEVWNRMKLVVLALSVFDLFLAVTGATPRYARFSWPLRPLFFLGKFRHCRKFFASILRSVPPVARVGFFFLFVVGVFAGLGFVVFGNSGIYTDEVGTEWRHKNVCDRRCPFLVNKTGTNVTSRITCPPPDLHACALSTDYSAFLDYANSENCNDFFGTFFTSVMNLFVFLTTANYPDVMLPYYNFSGMSFVYFFAFSAFGIFFLMNILLAAIFDSYNLDMKSKVTKQLKKRQQSLAQAFVWLERATPKYAPPALVSAPDAVAKRSEDEDDSTTPRNRSVSTTHMILKTPSLADRKGLALSAWMDLFRVVRSKLPKQAAEIMFVVAASEAVRRVDSVGTASKQTTASRIGTLNEKIVAARAGHLTASYDAFQILCFFLTLNIGYKKDADRGTDKDEDNSDDSSSDDNDSEAFDVRLMNWFRIYTEKTKELSNSKTFNRTFDVLSFVAIAVSLCGIIADDSDPSADLSCETGMVVVSVFLSSLFVGEAVVKISGKGPISYFTSVEDMTDFIATFGFWFSVIVTGQFCGSNAVYVFILRTARLCRILQMSKKQREHLESGYSVVRVIMSRYGVIVFFWFYFFAVLGMELFPSSAFDDNTVPPLTSYVDSGYASLNFDDVGTSFVVLFYVMIGNNWPIVMEGAVAGTGTYWARLYFILWYIFSMMIMTNCITSFSIDCFCLLVKTGASKRRAQTAQWKRLLRRAPGFFETFTVEQGRITLTTIYFDKFLEEIQSAMLDRKRQREADTLSNRRTIRYGDALDHDATPAHSGRAEMATKEGASSLNDMVDHVDILASMRRRISSSRSLRSTTEEEEGVDGAKECGNEEDARGA